MSESDQTVNIRDYGAVADGVTDDLPALRAAVADLKEGGTVFIPPGEYFLNTRVNEPALFPPGSTMELGSNVDVTERSPEERAAAPRVRLIGATDDPA